MWLAEKTPNPPQTVEVGDDQPIQESEDGGMQEDTPEEKRAMEITVLEERIASLEKENGELQNALREMERTIALQENAVKEMAQALGSRRLSTNW